MFNISSLLDSILIKKYSDLLKQQEPAFNPFQQAFVPQHSPYNVTMQGRSSGNYETAPNIYSPEILQLMIRLGYDFDKMRAGVTSGVTKLPNGYKAVPPAIDAGLSLPGMGGMFGVDAMYSPQGEKRIMGTYRREF